MDRWELIDLMNWAPSQEEFPRVVIRSEPQLRSELERLKHRAPAVLALEGPIDQGLQFGFGGPYGGVRWAEHPVSNRSGTALADRIHCPDRIDFASEEDTIAFWPPELLPVDQVIDIVVYFYKTHRLPEWVAWNEWDPATHQWHVKPAVGAQSA